MIVSAEDKGTRNKKKININIDNNRLSPEDIEKIINDAEKFAEEDAELMMKRKHGQNRYPELESCQGFF